MANKTIVVVNRHVVNANKRAMAEGSDQLEPVFSIRRGRNGQPFYRKSVTMVQPCTLVYDPANPLPCGATVWLETTEDLVAKHHLECGTDCAIHQAGL